MKKDTLTGSYTSYLKRKVDRIEKRKLPRKIRAVIFFVVWAAICIGGIVIGAFNKSSILEKRYNSFIENPEISSVDFELLSYKNVAQIVETHFLGNSPSQLLLGGYFCEKDNYKVYPAGDGQSTILRIDDFEMTLEDSIVSDVNIKNGMVYYRDQGERKIYAYDISSGGKTDLGIENVGQFALYDSDYIYIDLSNSSLIYVDQNNKNHKTLIDSGVKSFAVAGNSILYLDSNRTLSKLGLSDNAKTVITNNVNVFSFSSFLWLQNNDKLIQKGLSEKKVSEYELNMPCNRLIGLTDIYIFFESSDGVYCHDIKKGPNHKLENGIFIGGSNEKVLLYNEESTCYSIIDITE